jgi:hypothetical protein
MTPAARVQAAIDVLDLWQSAADGLDRVLAAWGRANRYAGSGDRRAIADLTYGAVRRLRSAAWVAGAGENPSGREVMLGSLILDGSDFTAFFSGVGHAPQPLTPAETARLGQPLDGTPRPVCGEIGRRPSPPSRRNKLLPSPARCRQPASLFLAARLVSPAAPLTARAWSRCRTRQARRRRITRG